MRRLAALAFAAVALSACSGEQGERAQQLLTGAQTAQGKLHSATFQARIAFAMDGQRFSLVIDGGGYLKGPRAGDAVFSMHTEGVPGGGRFDLQAVARRGRVSMSMNGQRFTLPATSASTGQAQALDWSGTVLDVARYVKNVRVREGRVVNGERGATIAGVIDTKKLLQAISKLDTFARAAKIDDFGGKVGDIHAAVFVGERSGLIRSAVVTMSIEAEDKKADLELTYRLTSTNRAVAGL
ncbi:MAG TPA: hypothetical protein VGU26_07535 [Gaiellaceae bacterium]|jgi:hypothetical protein|nr:hypothetical protein [Gaiellaceae bacterium]